MYTFIYGAFFQVRSEEQGRTGVDSIGDAADAVVFVAEKPGAAPRLCRLKWQPKQQETQSFHQQPEDVDKVHIKPLKPQTA